MRHFGPRTDDVEDFIEKVTLIPWFENLENPTEQDEHLVRVTLEFPAQRYLEPEKGWGGLLEEMEQKVDAAIETHEMGEEAERLQVAFWAISEWMTETDSLDAHYDRLEERYKSVGDQYGHYKNTFLYPGEILRIPDKTLFYAAKEVMLAHLTPDFTFFQQAVDWLYKGHWPCGWFGDWPEGKLILV